MDELNNLAKIVIDRRLSIISSLDFDEKGHNKESKLISLLEKQPDSTSLQLIKLIYGKATKANQVSFRKLKSRVQNKLLNSLYFLEHNDPKFPVARVYEVQCIQLFHQANILKLEGEYALSEKIMKKCLRISVETEFTQYAVLSAQALRTLYADSRQLTKFEEISKELQRLQNIYLLEEEAESIYWSIKIASAHTVKTRRYLLDELPKFTKKLESIHNKIKSYLTFYYTYMLKINYYELTGDYEEIIKYTTKIDKLWESNKINKKRFDKRFNNFMNVYAHLRTRKVIKGLSLAEKYIKDIHYSSGNWFYFMEHYFLLAMYAKKYLQARELLITAHKNPFYRKQRTAAQQRWDLFEAYLHFVSPEGSLTRAMHFSRFIQTVPDYARDKQGYNIAILLLQFLYYLQAHDIEALLTRLESLRKYQQRHLRDSATLRSQLFFRLLLLTVKENFNAKIVEKKAQPLLIRLRETPQPGEAFAEIEIIPYEDMWTNTLDILYHWNDIKSNNISIQ